MGDQIQRMEDTFATYRMAILSEISGLRKLVILTTAIIIILASTNVVLNAYRVYLIDKKIAPMRVELESLYKEMDYECQYKKHDSRVQCGVRPTRQRLMDSTDNQ